MSSSSGSQGPKKAPRPVRKVSREGAGKATEESAKKVNSPTQSETGQKPSSSSALAASSGKAVPASGAAKKKPTSRQVSQGTGSQQKKARVAAVPVGAKPIKQAIPLKESVRGSSIPTEEEFESMSSFSEWARDLSGVLISVLVHVVILLILGIWVIDIGGESNTPELIGQSDIPTEQLDQVEPLKEELDIESEELEQFETFSETTLDLQDSLDGAAPAAVEQPVVNTEVGALPGIGSNIDIMQSAIGTGTQGSGPLNGRGAGRGTLVRQNGGNKQSEEAVASALRWLAAHQLRKDGGWSFNHIEDGAGFCPGKGKNPGALRKARNGATALALLPFLGAGNTHEEGDYKQNVGAGLYFLASRVNGNSKGGLWEEGGRMYSHGLGTIALCEAYGMTKDARLAGPAQVCVNYCSYAQDGSTGGWGYYPKQGKDTSVAGWQIMGLKSGLMGGLRINTKSVKGAEFFLTTVSAGDGAFYGYRSPAKKGSTTAVGLLCRMYMNKKWRPGYDPLDRGVKFLAGIGPTGDLYHDYYAAQVLFQYTNAEGPLWEEYNTALRDALIASQVKHGCERGSWYFEKGHGPSQGGRLYCTALACLILEVYYRHMPISRHNSDESVEDFPL